MEYLSYKLYIILDDNLVGERPRKGYPRNGREMKLNLRPFSKSVQLRQWASSLEIESAYHHEISVL